MWVVFKSRLAQFVEWTTLSRVVVGSIPTSGAYHPLDMSSGYFSLGWKSSWGQFPELNFLVYYLIQHIIIPKTAFTLYLKMVCFVLSCSIFSNNNILNIYVFHRNTYFSNNRLTNCLSPQLYQIQIIPYLKLIN